MGCIGNRGQRQAVETLRPERLGRWVVKPVVGLL